MNKVDLIQELTTSKESAYRIFMKGYLHHFPMDSDIYTALLPKITAEANHLGLMLEAYNRNPQSFSEDELSNLSESSSELESLVFNVCFRELQKETYVSKSIGQIQKQLSPSFLKQYTDKQDQGYEVLVEDDSLKIIDIAGQLTYLSMITPMKDILQEWGVDTSHPQFYLFYFTLVPPDDLETYRKIHLFSIFFKFV